MRSTSAVRRGPDDGRLAAERSTFVEAMNTRAVPATFMEGHHGLTWVIAVIVLIITGLVIGKGVGELGVFVIDAVLPHANPAA